ncbi:MAG TPA: YggS family pyridoxal phosphate-dependent enzyme [Chthoniobacterales bacterium]
MSSPFSSMSEAVEQIKNRIAGAAARSGRTASDVELVAVSKTHPVEAIRDAQECGLTIFGESKFQEARAKITESPSRARWHFIGHLQSNKVRAALPLFELFHGVDSLDLAATMNRIASELGLFPRVLLEVNMAGESSKFGFNSGELPEKIESLLELDRLQIEGLMTIPPYADNPEHSRPFFVGLRELRDRLATECDVRLDTLSMGMSGDFEVAIEEGATIVRIGTAIFGARSYKQK